MQVIGNAYYRDKRKKKVRQASDWKEIGYGFEYTIKEAIDGRRMLIAFGGVHPKIWKFANKQDYNKFMRRLLRQSGYNEDKKGRFYVGK